MFNRDVKADWTSKAYRFTRKGDAIHGSVKTAWPLKLRTAFVTWSRINAAYFAAMFMLFETNFIANHMLNAVAGIIWLGVIFALPIFLLFVHGVPVKITNEHIAVGDKRYQLGDIGTLNAVKARNKRDLYVIEFHHGLKRRRIRLLNTFEHQLHAVEMINKQIGECRSETVDVKVDDLTQRSASF